jgi:hypothetical protein
MPATFRKSVLYAVVIAALAVPSWGQNNIRSIVRMIVIPGHVGDYQAAVREFNEVLKKAGWPQPRTSWRSTTGPNEFASTIYWRSLADLDKVMSEDPKLKEYAGQLTAISARIAACIEHSERIIDEIQPDLSIPGSEVPPMVRVLRAVVKPDRVADFLTLLRSELFPAVQQSGLKSYVVSRTHYGGPATEFRLVMGIGKWADLAALSPIQVAMGGTKYVSFQQKWASMVVEYQADVYRFQPDLSYIPASPAATSTR